MQFYNQTIDSNIKSLNSNTEHGLDNRAIESGRKKYGSNVLKASNSRSIIKILFYQFKSPLVIILIVATLVSYYLGICKMKALKKHWEKVFETKAENELSWFQPYPKTSVEFLELFNLPHVANIIDIGGGDSHLVDMLIEMDYSNIYILDISANALDRAKKRLGDNANKVNWIVSDITDFKPKVKFDFWHDRAAFHFLTSEDQVNKYVSIAEKAIIPGGYLILGTFSETGPTKCSGLEIKQYNETSMSYRFEKSFERIKCIEEIHASLFNTTQNFLFCSFKRMNL